MHVTTENSLKNSIETLLEKKQLFLNLHFQNAKANTKLLISPSPFIPFYSIADLDFHLYVWDLCIFQGTAVRVELGDATTAADPADVHSISRSFPLTYGQPLAHFLRATAKVSDAQIITDHPAFRYALGPGDL